MSRKIKFLRQFFGPNAVRYRPDVWYDSIPDDWDLPTRIDAKTKKVVPDYEEDTSAPVAAPQVAKNQSGVRSRDAVTA